MLVVAVAPIKPSKPLPAKPKLVVSKLFWNNGASGALLMALLLVLKLSLMGGFAGTVVGNTSKSDEASQFKSAPAPNGAAATLAERSIVAARPGVVAPAAPRYSTTRLTLNASSEVSAKSARPSVFTSPNPAMKPLVVGKP